MICLFCSLVSFSLTISYRVFRKNCVFFQRIILPPLPRQYWAAIRRSENCEPIRVTVHWHSVRTLKIFCRRGKGCRGLAKNHNLSWTSCIICFLWTFQPSYVHKFLISFTLLIDQDSTTFLAKYILPYLCKMNNWIISYTWVLQKKIHPFLKILKYSCPTQWQEGMKNEKIL